MKKIITFFLMVNINLVYLKAKNSNGTIIFSEIADLGVKIKSLDVNSKKEQILFSEPFRPVKSVSFIKPNSIIYLSKNEIITWTSNTGKKSESFPHLLLSDNDKKSISVSSKGDKIVYLKTIDYKENLKIYYKGQRQKYKPVGYKAELHILDLKTKKDKIISVNALSGSLYYNPTWSIDGNQIAFVSTFEKKHLDANFLNTLQIAKNKPITSVVPLAIFIYDLKDENSEFISLGVMPKISPDNKKMLSVELGNRLSDRLKIIDLITKKEVILPTQGAWHISDICWSSDSKFIAYLGRPKRSFIRTIEVIYGHNDKDKGLWITSTGGLYEKYLRTGFLKKLIQYEMVRD